MSIRNVNWSKVGDPHNPDLVYYNLDIINGKTIDEGIASNPKAKFNETRDTAVISDTSKYYFSIVRFTMDGCGKTLPILIPRVEIGQSDPDKTAYQSYIKAEVLRGGTTYTLYPSASTKTYVEWVSQSTQARPPQPPIETQDLETPYYYCYTYDHFVELVNTMWVNIFNDFNAQLVTLGVAPLTTEPPVMKYDPSTQRFRILFDTHGWGGKNALSFGTPTQEQFNLFFNSNMYGLFSNFPMEYQGGDLASLNAEAKDGYAYEILCKGGLGTEVFRQTPAASPTLPNTPSYWVVEQDFKSTTSLWSPIGSIVFVSTLIPVLNEQTGQPIQYGGGNVVNPIGTQSAFQPIITDIALQNEYAHSYSEFLSYVPSAEYRLSTLSNSPQEVRNIDIQIYWKSRLDGNLYPIELFNLSNIQVKIMFRRRDFEAGRTIDPQPYGY